MRLTYLVFVLAACGSSSNPQSDAPAQHDAPKAIDAPKQFLDAPPGTAPLTVKNYLSWCSVSVNGGTASSGPSQTVNVAPGTIPLVAKAASATFTVSGNMWHHTNGDTGTGETGTVTGTGANLQSAANVTVSTTAKCVWVCCPFANGTGCTGIADQCP